MQNNIVVSLNAHQNNKPVYCCHNATKDEMKFRCERRANEPTCKCTNVLYSSRHACISILKITTNSKTDFNVSDKKNLRTIIV